MNMRRPPHHSTVARDATGFFVTQAQFDELAKRADLTPVLLTVRTILVSAVAEGRWTLVADAIEVIARVLRAAPPPPTPGDEPGERPARG